MVAVLEQGVSRDEKQTSRQVAIVAGGNEGDVEERFGLLAFPKLSLTYFDGMRGDLTTTGQRGGYQPLSFDELQIAPRAAAVFDIDAAATLSAAQAGRRPPAVSPAEVQGSSPLRELNSPRPPPSKKRKAPASAENKE